MPLQRGAKRSFGVGPGPILDNDKLDERPPSANAMFLHDLWKRGRIGAASVGQGAAAQVADGTHHESVTRKFRKIGREGNTNSHRDLTRKLAHHCWFPDVYQAEVPLWDKRRGRSYKSLCNFILFTEVLDKLAVPGTEADWAECGDSQAEW